MRAPADGFNDAERALAIVEGEEDRRHLSEILRERAIPDQVADDAKQFRQHHADDLGARRDVDSGQLLHCREIGQVVHHAAQVIHAIGVRNVGVPGLALTHLFGAAVVEADFGNGIDDLFAIELQSDAQDTVRARMLGAEIEKHEIRAVAFATHAPFFGTEAQRLLLGHFLFRRQLIRPHLRRASWMVLAQRMSDPALRHQNALQMRMPVKNDSEHVPHFALVPVGRRPDVA